MNSNNNDRIFFGIVSYSTALAFSFAVGSLEALRMNAAGFAFHISAWTFVAGAIGAALTLAYWRIVLNDAKAKTHALLRGASVALALAGVAAFLYPLRFVSTDALLQIGRGLGFAVFALSLVAVMLLRIKKFLEEDEARTAGSH